MRNVVYAGTGPLLEFDFLMGEEESLNVRELLSGCSFLSNHKQEGKFVKKLLLVGLAVGGLAFVAGSRADAQISRGLPGVGGISFGFPGGYYAYPRAYNYYPYGYYLRPYYSYSQPYSYRYGSSHNGHRTYHRHHRYHHSRY